MIASKSFAEFYEKMNTAETSTWITDELSEDERRAAEFIADVVVSVQRETRNNKGRFMSTFGEKLIESAKQAKEHAAGHCRLRTVTMGTISGTPIEFSDSEDNRTVSTSGKYDKYQNGDFKSAPHESREE